MLGFCSWPVYVNKITAIRQYLMREAVSKDLFVYFLKINTIHHETFQ